MEEKIKNKNIVENGKINPNEHQKNDQEIWYDRYEASRKEKKEIFLSRGNFNFYRNILIIFILITMVNIGVYITLLVVIQSKGVNVSEVQNILEGKLREEQQLKLLKNVVAMTTRERERLDSYFVNSGEVSRLIGEIESLGDDAGLVLAFKAVEIEGTDDKFLRLEFETGGDFDDIFYLLALLESMPWKATFEKFFIEKQDESLLRTTDLGGEWHGLFTIYVFNFLD